MLLEIPESRVSNMLIYGRVYAYNLQINPPIASYWADTIKSPLAVVHERVHEGGSTRGREYR